MMSKNVVQFQRGYNRVGNRTYRTDTLHANNSETYTYDGVNQIKSLSRVGFSESWNYDATGNWLQYDKNCSVENRVHNTANEIQATCTHDKNGNMTVLPGMTCKYDAWNRLVEVGSNIRYDYNGLNQRVRKTVNNVVTTSFFNSQWQELESVTSGDTSVYVWGLRYIDDLVLHECGTERLYSLADANWNVVATVDTSGVVQERMKYDAFGKVAWMNSAFGSKSASAYAWNRTFTGQVLDSETGLMFYRNRYYHPGLGRFISRGPIGYDADPISLYRYVAGVPVLFIDPYGLFNMQSCIAEETDICIMQYPGLLNTSARWMCLSSVNAMCDARKKGTDTPKTVCDTVSLYDDRDKSKYSSRCDAAILGGALPMQGKGMSAVTNFTKGKDCCIKNFNIIDHGGNGAQQVGEHLLTSADARTLCDSLCYDATITLYGCNVGAGELSTIDYLMYACARKIKKIVACNGYVVSPCYNDKEGVDSCINNLEQYAKYGIRCRKGERIDNPDGTRTYIDLGEGEWKKFYPKGYFGQR